MYSAINADACTHPDFQHSSDRPNKPVRSNSMQKKKPSASLSDIPVKTASLYRGIRVTSCKSISTLRSLDAQAISELGKAPVFEMGASAWALRCCDSGTGFVQGSSIVQSSEDG